MSAAEIDAYLQALDEPKKVLMSLAAMAVRPSKPGPFEGLNSACQS